jgi:hypothetical protein
MSCSSCLLSNHDTTMTCGLCLSSVLQIDSRTRCSCFLREYVLYLMFRSSKDTYPTMKTSPDFKHQSCRSDASRVLPSLQYKACEALRFELPFTIAVYLRKKHPEKLCLFCPVPDLLESYSISLHGDSLPLV